MTREESGWELAAVHLEDLEDHAATLADARRYLGEWSGPVVDRLPPSPWELTKEHLDETLVEEDLMILLDYVDGVGFRALASSFGLRDSRAAAVRVRQILSTVLRDAGDWHPVREFLGVDDVRRVAPGFLVPRRQVRELASHIVRSVGDLALSPHNGSLGLGEPCLEWRDSGGGGFRIRFDANPVELTATIGLGRFDLGPAAAVGRLDPLHTPLLRFVVPGTGEGGVDPLVEAVVPVADLDGTAPIELLWQALGDAQLRAWAALGQVPVAALTPTGPEASQEWLDGSDLQHSAATARTAQLPQLEDGTRAALDHWIDAGLGRPFVPSRFAQGFGPVGDWAWGCIPSARSGAGPDQPEEAYLLWPEVERFMAGDWRERYYLNRVGAWPGGVNYFIVTDRLAVFAQTGWGLRQPTEGEDPADERAWSVALSVSAQNLGADLNQVFRFVEAVEEWPEGRLLVVHSDFRGGVPPRWVRSPQSNPEPLSGNLAEGVTGALHHVHGMWLADQGQLPQGGGEDDLR